MAALWPLSRTKEYDINGDPLVGAKAYFFDPNTLTPQTVYQNAALGESHDHPVLTDSYGRWPAVFLSPEPGEYRIRVVGPDGVTLFDDDEVSVPLSAEETDEGAGETSITLLFRTGQMIDYYGTTALSGWVRCSGRTIGSASSGASERAHADCEELFKHLWSVDSSLSVSGGRGANAAADWSANKTIALPDFRHRARFGLGDMGNSNAGLIANDLMTAGNNATLGSKTGVSTIALSVAQMPTHGHSAGPLSGSTNTTGSHSHNMGLTNQFGNGNDALVGSGSRDFTTSTLSTGNHSHTVSISAFSTSEVGGGQAHNNMPPGVLVTVLIKL